MMSVRRHSVIILTAALAVVAATLAPRWWRSLTCQYQFSDFPIKEIAVSSLFSSASGFAGAYVVTTRDCGPSCQSSTITDHRDEKVVADDLLSELGLDYRPDSRLLIAHGRVERGDEYYLLDSQQRFQFLCRTGVVCLPTSVNARHPLTGEIGGFDRPCDVPLGWQAFP